MFTTEQNNILSLIAATIFADKRVFASEIEAFVKAARNLRPLRRSKNAPSEADILLWYETNKPDIQGKISTPYFKDWYYDLLEKLSDIPEKNSILEVMQEVSRADGSVHVSERALMMLAKRHWGLD